MSNPQSHADTVDSTAASLTKLGLHAPATTWSVFTRLVHQLDAYVRVTDQIQQALDAVLQCTGADAVCWYDEVTNEVLCAADAGDASAEGCRAFAHKLLTRFQAADTPAFLWHRPAGAGDCPPGAPLSAAAVRPHPRRPGWILAFSLRPEHPLGNTELRLIGLAGAMLVKQSQHTRAFTQLKDALLGLVRCLTVVIDAKDSCTAGHSERVSRIAVRVGKQMGLPSHVISDLHLAGLLHDVGKVGIRDEVLLKPGKLTPEELDHIREHVVIGDQIVGAIKPFARLRGGVRHHHERYDGRGYPDGLAGTAIPLVARILAVADSCDAMMSARRYRAPLTPPQIDAMFVKNAGTQWDPEVVEHFLACRQDLYPPIYPRGIGDSAHFAIAEIVESLKDGSAPDLPASTAASRERQRPECAQEGTLTPVADAPGSPQLTPFTATRRPRAPALFCSDPTATMLLVPASWLSRILQRQPSSPLRWTRHLDAQGGRRTRLSPLAPAAAGGIPWTGGPSNSQ